MKQQSAKPPTITIRDLVAEHARRAPLSPAIISDGVTFSYGDLDVRASEVASELKRAGVVEGARIGLYLEPAPRMLAALLGAMEAGAVSVPLGTEQPVARALAMFQDAAVSWLLTEQGIEKVGDAAVAGPDTSDSAACILYRSGCEGRPVGVPIPHRALTNPAGYASVSLLSSDRIAQPINMARDGSFFGLFNAIAAGACVIEISLANNLSPGRLARFLHATAATIWLTSAAELERIGSEFPGELKNLRLILSDDPGELLARLEAKLKPGLMECVRAIYQQTERLDRHIVIRGERIHLAEIEAALLRHSAVRAAQVELTDPATPDQRGLVAVVIPQAGQLPAPGELQDFLRQQLPAIMIPRIVVDPQTGTEEELTRIWQQVLKREQVGASDNFFDLGGHSMALVQVGALIKQRLGIKVSLPVLLSCPTIHSLASRLDHARAANG